MSLITAPRCPARAEPGRASCTASALLRLAGAGDHASPATDALHFPIHRFAPRAVVARGGERQTALLVVLRGGLKAECTGELGDTQVTAFYLPGDAFGLEALGEAACGVTATALEATEAALLPVDRLLAAARDTRGVDRFVRALIARELAMRSRILGIVAPPVAEVGLARFLLELIERLAGRERADRVVRLCMSRRDIAGHLGIAHETVSRAFGALAKAGCISLAGRAVAITDLASLQQQALRRTGRPAADDRASATSSRARTATTAAAAPRQRPPAVRTPWRPPTAPALDPIAWMRTPLPPSAAAGMTMPGPARRGVEDLFGSVHGEV